MTCLPACLPGWPEESLEALCLGRFGVVLSSSLGMGSQEFAAYAGVLVSGKVPDCEMYHADCNVC